MFRLEEITPYDPSAGITATDVMLHLMKHYTELPLSNFFSKAQPSQIIECSKQIHSTKLLLGNSAFPKMSDFDAKVVSHVTGGGG